MKKTGKAAAAGLAAVLSLCLAIPAWATGSLDDAKKKKSSLEEEKKKTEAAIKSLEGLKSDAAACKEAGRQSGGHQRRAFQAGEGY